MSRRNLTENMKLLGVNKLVLISLVILQGILLKGQNIEGNTTETFRNHNINTTIDINDSFNTTTNKTDLFNTTTPTTSTTRFMEHDCKKCNTDGEYDGEYDVDIWPQVCVNQSASVPCPNSKYESMKWKCMPNGEFDQNGPNTTECDLWMNDLHKPKDVEGAIHLIEIIFNNTEEDNNIVSNEKFNRIMNKIEEIQQVVDSKTDLNIDNARTYTNKTIELFSNLINQKYAWTKSTNEQKTEIASRLISYIQYSCFTLASKQKISDAVETIRSENIYISTFITDPSKELNFPADEYSKNISISIPEGITSIRQNRNQYKTAIGAVVYKLHEYLLGNNTEHKQINSIILSFSLSKGTESVELNKEVTIKLRHEQRLHFGEEIECVFWNFNSSSWSSKGCYKDDEESDLLTTVCKCNHLTNFAALMDTSGKQENNGVKSKMTTVCCIISMTGLAITILISFSSKKSGEKDANFYIVLFLCISLFMVNLLVVTFMDMTNDKSLCQFASGLLLYFLLSSFFWMLLEGLQIYKRINDPSNDKYNPNYPFAVGFGLPIIICIIGLFCIWFTENMFIGVLFDERYNHFCWISSIRYKNNIWILVGPVLVTMFLNGILAYASVRKVFFNPDNPMSSRSGKKLLPKEKKALGFICLFSILGFTWLFFVLFINQRLEFLSYLFILLNGSQGVFIFLYHFYLNIKVDANENESE